MRCRLPAVLLLLAVAGCAGSNRFVLLEEEDGSVGAITIENRAGSQTVTRARTATRVTRLLAAPSTPEEIDEAEIARTWGPALRAMPLQPRSFRLYFVFESDVLTEESADQLPAILDSIRAYPAPEVSIVGHTDRMGPAASNIRLGFDRARAIRAALLREGLAPALMEIASHGETDPLVPTPDEVPEPRNRRVEVMVR